MRSQSWLDIARELFTLSRSGLAYSQNPFDLDRYKKLDELGAKIVSQNTDLSLEDVQRSFSMQAGYPTPKVDIRGVLIEDGKLLMVRELTDGKWSMPGGWADLGDSPAEVVIREVWEESGYEVKVRKLIGVFNGKLLEPLDFYHAYKMVFICDRVGGEARTSFESPEVDWFPLNALPELSPNRTPVRVLYEIRAHLADPARATFFE